MYGLSRGLGGGQMIDGVYVMDTPITTDTVTSSGTNVYTDSSGNITVGSSGQSATSWLNANGTMVALGGGALLLLLLVAKAGR